MATRSPTPLNVYSFFSFFSFLSSPSRLDSHTDLPAILCLSNRFVTLRVDRRRGKDGVSLTLTCDKDADTTVLARVVFEFRHRLNPRLSLFRSSSMASFSPFSSALKSPHGLLSSRRSGGGGVLCGRAPWDKREAQMHKPGRLGSKGNPLPPFTPSSLLATNGLMVASCLLCA